ncbi:MAG: hypothetical protein DMG14_10500 [Acidobacteria bacterium]|nr:MAG: hypothetical protein DMG14_10500 [Acidobacteriota bacterium]
MTDLELLSRRLSKTELQLRWMKRGAILLGFLVTAGTAMAQLEPELDPFRLLRSRPDQRVTQQAPAETEVRSHHFVLVDDKGKDRASLVADGAGSVFLVMFDAAGKTRANLSVSNDGPSLVFYDLSGQQRTIIGSTTLVGSHVNENGMAEKAPASSVVLFDKAGKLLWRQP